MMALTIGPGQATNYIDVVVQDTKICYLSGSITLAQMCARVHALCKMQRECISAMCKPGRRGLSVAEARYLCVTFFSRHRLEVIKA
jgi:hypothetical protein